MPTQQAPSAETDQNRNIIRALAALREAAEYLDDAIAASEHADIGTASALSHVAAARKALRPQGIGRGREAVDQDAA